MDPGYSPVNIAEAGLLLDIFNDRRPLRLSNIKADLFVELAKLHNVTPLVFYKLQKHGQQVPEELYLSLKPYYIGNLTTNLKFWKEFLKINEAFKENNISLLPLKGVDILARFYPAFDLRSMVDIDILIKEEQFTDAEKVLFSLGYQKNLRGLKEEYWRKHQCHIAFYKERAVLEVHWGLDFKRGDRVILPRIWERMQQIELRNHKINTFSPEDAIFSFALHLRRYGNILALKQVLDAAQIINKTTDFDWSYVLEESKRGRMEATLYFLLTQVLLFTDTPVPEDILKRLQVPFWQKKLIRKFLLKNTFLTEPSCKRNYLKAHFLLYDTLLEALLYLINIPYEQFCKFYNFKPYTAASRLLYNLRLFYMPLRHILGRTG